MVAAVCSCSGTTFSGSTSSAGHPSHSSQISRRIHRLRERTARVALVEARRSYSTARLCPRTLSTYSAGYWQWHYSHRPCQGAASSHTYPGSHPAYLFTWCLKLLVRCDSVGGFDSSAVDSGIWSLRSCQVTEFTSKFSCPYPVTANYTRVRKSDSSGGKSAASFLGLWMGTYDVLV